MDTAAVRKSVDETSDQLIPNYPHFGNVEWESVIENGDFGYIFFEWYRWIGNLATVVAFIQPDSPDFRSSSNRTYYLTSGLMARCSRLMLSVIALTYKREFGEAASIIHRSLMETAAKLIWVCAAESDERARRLILDGLKPEIEFERYIKANIAKYKRDASDLEYRMLQSIQNHFDAGGVSKAEVEGAKRLPDLYTIFESIGWSRLEYVVLQRLGSHAVHGNWPALVLDYLEQSHIDGFEFMPRGTPVPLHANIYMTGGRLVLEAIAAFSNLSLADDSAIIYLTYRRDRRFDSVGDVNAVSTLQGWALALSSIRNPMG